MVILKADHPVIVAAQFRIRLPKAVAMFPLETLFSPCLSRLPYWIVQTSLTDYSVNPVMVYVGAFVVEVTGYLAGSPTIPFSQLDDSFLL
jgi:hypothetical protein